MTKTNEENETKMNLEIADQMLDRLLKDFKTPEQIAGKDGLLKQLTKRLVERAMACEMTNHLGYEKHSPDGYNGGNSRNGYSGKTIKGEFGEMEIEIPRDRQGRYEPQIIPKRQTRFNGFDSKIISMYALGMTQRDIQWHLKDMYGVEVSPDLISSVTDGVSEEVKEWQSRPLDKMYPILYLDALMLKIKDEGHIMNKAIYLAMGIDMSGEKKLLGMWAGKAEGAKFWLQILTDLKNRGVEDILIACVDGLKGFPEAINAMYPKTEVQLCIVHIVRNSLRYVPYKDRKKVATDLKSIYRAANAEQAKLELDNFSKAWDSKYPTISKMWESNWANIIPFFAYPPEIRKIIYTTNAIESLNYSLRKIIKGRASFPNDESALKLMYLGIRNVSRKWTMPVRNWGEAINQFALVFGDRVPLNV